MDYSRLKLSMSNEFFFGDKCFTKFYSAMYMVHKIVQFFRIEAHKEMRLERDAFYYNRGQYFLISLLVNSKQKTFLCSRYTNRNFLDTSRGHF
jgi:hypothetical protein